MRNVSLGERKTQLVTRIYQIDRELGNNLSLTTQRMRQRKLKSSLNRVWWKDTADPITYIIVIVDHLLGGGGCLVAADRALVYVQVHLEALEAAHEEHDGHGQDPGQDHRDGNDHHPVGIVLLLDHTLEWVEEILFETISY